MNALVINVDRKFSQPVWHARYWHPGMTALDLMFKAQCLQHDGTLDCLEMNFHSTAKLSEAVRVFFQFWYRPDVDQPELCPSRMGEHASMPASPVNVSVFHDLISGTWGINRMVGVSGRRRLQYLKLGLPVHINEWSDQPQVGGRDRVLYEFKMLALNPHFAEV